MVIEQTVARVESCLDKEIGKSEPQIIIHFDI